ncbi:MAG: aldehyde dehydrogenase [Phycisphaerae bacterium]|nr:aldehyde dehydrogenase [Phycisphaerae bacterium]
MERLTNFIAGEHRPPESGQWLDVVEPATGAVYAQAPDSDASDVERAVSAAAAAFPAWSAVPAPERSRVLFRLADLLESNAERLARAESVDTGKPIALARRVDVPRSIANLRFFAGAVLHAAGEMFETDTPAAGGAERALNYTLRRPRGVAGLITPWNLPLYLLTWKIAPALATGNTVVAKPSEVTPMTAHLLTGLAREAGLPPGVLNVVHGRGDQPGAALVAHPDVPTLSFTGSTRVGRWIARTAGDLLKRVSLELGGKNPFVVFDDADLDDAARTAARAAFTNQGQVCLCGSRLIVHRAVADRVVDALAAWCAQVRIGDPLDDATDFGALTSDDHLHKVAGMVEEARRLGGRVVCGGARVPPARLPARCGGGAFYLPTVVTGLDPACRVEQEEIFGPVVTVQTFDTEDQAIALANATPYGLAATLFTRDVSRAHRAAAALDAGVVWVNCWMLRDLRTPFGGTKQSGVGREGGAEALRFFTEPRNVCLRL